MALYPLLPIGSPDESGLLTKENLLALANTRMPFGRYAGWRLINLPDEYLLWFSHREMPEGKLGERMALALTIKLEGLEYLVRPLINS